MSFHSPQVLTTEPYLSPPRQDIVYIESSAEENQRIQRLNAQLKENGFSPVPAQKKQRPGSSVQKLRSMVTAMRRQLDLLEAELEMVQET